MNPTQLYKSLQELEIPVMSIDLEGVFLLYDAGHGNLVDLNTDDADWIMCGVMEDWLRANPVHESYDGLTPWEWLACIAGTMEMIGEGATKSEALLACCKAVKAAT